MANFNREREEEIRKRVTRRIQRRMLFVLDFGLFFAFGLVTSGMYFGGFLSMMLMGWFMLTVVHAVYVVYAEWADRAVSRAVEQERNAYYRAVAETVLAEFGERKRKRGERIALTDDGELDDSLESEFEEREYRKRR